MHQRHKPKVRKLHSRPDHPILLHRIKIRALKLGLRIRPFQHSHRSQEKKHVPARK